MYEDWTTDELLRWRNQMATEFSPNMGEQNRRLWAHRFWPVQNELMRRANGGGEVIDDRDELRRGPLWGVAIAMFVGGCVGAIWWILETSL